MTELALTVDAREAKGLPGGAVTRLVRVVEKQPDVDARKHRWGMALGADGILTWGRAPWPKTDPHNYIEEDSAVSPFGVAGDRLRAVCGEAETMQDFYLGEDYAAKFHRPIHYEPIPIILDVTDVRVVRLDQVTEEDMLAAGLIKTSHYGAPAYGLPGWVMNRYLNVASCVFRWLVTDDVKANPWLWLAKVARVDDLARVGAESTDDGAQTDGADLGE